MAIISATMARTAFATTLGDIYTVPTANTTTIVTNIVVVNTAAAAASFKILLDGTELFNDTVIAANATISIDLRQVLQAQPLPAKKITGSASATTVKIHISGVEIV
jgi:mRNA-degrading endonuclease toxin of MazEF toxin-antitoxin module